MKRTIDYLKNLKDDVTHSLEDEYSDSITVDANDLRHIDEALEDIKKYCEALNFYSNKFHYMELADTHITHMSDTVLGSDKGEIARKTLGSN